MILRLAAFDLDGTLVRSYMESVRCADCGGSGRRLSNEDGAVTTINCKPCKGSGRVLREDPECPYPEVQVLPRRRETVQFLRENGVEIAICTNQGGVAFGHRTQAEVEAKLARVAEALGLGGYTIDPRLILYCGHHPHARVERWRRDCDCRKPKPGLIQRAMEITEIPPQGTLFVGDLPTDEQAAEAAGVLYAHPDDFFDGWMRQAMEARPAAQQWSWKD